METKELISGRVSYGMFEGGEEQLEPPSNLARVAGHAAARQSGCCASRRRHSRIINRQLQSAHTCIHLWPPDPSAAGDRSSLRSGIEAASQLKRAPRPAALPQAARRPRQTPAASPSLPPGDLRRFSLAPSSQSAALLAPRTAPNAASPTHRPAQPLLQTEAEMQDGKRRARGGRLLGHLPDSSTRASPPVASVTPPSPWPTQR
ncbi:hypothetical protein CDD83_1519 [Cordyceps sp. RAO-2017]|nr:hypothetical protein CDD83_1519 [Cordyceps sp. RAO-2017]